MSLLEPFYYRGEGVVYTEPRSIFQKKIQSILKSETKEVSKVFSDVFALQQALLIERAIPVEKDNYKSVLELYSIIGLEAFTRLVSCMKGKTITIPTDGDLKESILTVLCYYYREIEKKSWDDIREITGLQKTDTIKYGIRTRQLEQFIGKKLYRAEGCEDEQN